DRRIVLLTTTACAMAAALALVFLAGSEAWINFLMVFVFGSFAMPLFSLSAAHANVRAGKDEFVLVNAALMMFYSFGAIGGPLLASWAMPRHGAGALFKFMAVIILGLILIIFYRMGARSSVPASRRSRFTALLRTSTVFARLARRSGGPDKPSDQG